MVGFVASLPQSAKNPPLLSQEAKDAAAETGVTEEEMQRYLGLSLPKPVPQPEEMEDVRWFHFDFMDKALSVSEPQPNAFCIPGSHAIASRIIHDWMSERRQQRGSWNGDQFEDVEIDEGRFKYILVRVSEGERSKIIVRGIKGRPYHMNIFEVVQAEAAAINAKVEPLGGGRIEHDASRGEISIYGYSSGFGTGVHEITAVLCKRAYPFYDNISLSYSGY